MEKFLSWNIKYFDKSVTKKSGFFKRTLPTSGVFCQKKKKIFFFRGPKNTQKPCEERLFCGIIFQTSNLIIFTKTKTFSILFSLINKDMSKCWNKMFFVFETHLITPEISNIKHVQNREIFFYNALSKKVFFYVFLLSINERYLFVKLSLATFLFFTREFSSKSCDDRNFYQKSENLVNFHFFGRNFCHHRNLTKNVGKKQKNVAQ